MFVVVSKHDNERVRVLTQYTLHTHDESAHIHSTTWLPLAHITRTATHTMDVGRDNAGLRVCVVNAVAGVHASKMLRFTNFLAKNFPVLDIEDEEGLVLYCIVLYYMHAHRTLGQ